MKMPQHRLARIALWIMAALIAALTAFGPTTAAAHPEHEHGRHIAAVASSSEAATFDLAVLLPSPSPHKAEIVSQTPENARYVAPGDTNQAEHGICGGACCSGSGCCFSAYLTAPLRLIPAPVAKTVILPMPQGRVPSGIDQAALLEPPRPFT